MYLYVMAQCAPKFFLAHYKDSLGMWPPLLQMFKEAGPLDWAQLVDHNC